MAELTTPWTAARQARAVQVLDSIDARVCSPERLLSWNEVDTHAPDGACVVYWMARSQRGEHNLALDCALAAGHSLELPVVVVFRLAAGPTGTELRHVDWMLRGLVDAFAACARRGAHVLLVDRGGPTLDELCMPHRLHAALVITDDDVMPRARRGRAAVAARIGAPLVSVDADAIVPGACVPRQEYAARTIRPKLHALLPTFELEFGDPADRSPPRSLETDIDAIPGVWRFDPARPSELPGGGVQVHLESAVAAGTPTRAHPLSDRPSGTDAAVRQLTQFVESGLAGYATRRNRPELDATSELSPFVHFGQVSPHVVLAAVRASGAPVTDVDTFVEEFVVRRELATNFVRWNALADQLSGAPDWARRTLGAHAADPRPWLWDDDTLEAGDSEDPLWNAAQRQLVEHGHMHGYLRMYWAKQLLLWRQDPADAFDVALRLNDRWSLDGRDPNGITGVAWAIGGVHDRPWGERDVFGQVRCMTLASTGRKFDSRAYVARWGGLRGAALQSPGRYAPPAPNLLDGQ